MTNIYPVRTPGFGSLKDLKDLLCAASSVNFVPWSDPKSCFWSEVQGKCVCCDSKKMFDCGSQRCIDPREKLPIVTASTPKEQTEIQKGRAREYLKSAIPNINRETFDSYVFVPGDHDLTFFIRGYFEIVDFRSIIMITDTSGNNQRHRVHSLVG